MNELTIVKAEASSFETRPIRLLWDFFLQSYNSLKYRRFLIVNGTVMILATRAMYH